MKKIFRLMMVFSLGLLPLVGAGAATLKIAYSDWPGWVAWDIAEKKGFFKAEGLDVQLLWFDYVPSMEAFAAGQVDGVCVTNGDALVTGATGARNIMILLNDYSNGNDMIVARSGITSVKDLKGKKIGVEVGFVDHLLLLKALEANGLKESDVKIVNMVTGQAAQTLASGEVDAVAAWQPNSGQALQSVKGSTAIYTSANVPGLIYDALAVSPSSLAAHKAEWTKVVKVWYQVVDFLSDPKNAKEVLDIMAARVNVKPGEYAAFMSGTKFLTLAAAKKAFLPTAGMDSLQGSSTLVDGFNVANGVYAKNQKIESYIDSSLINSLK